MNRNELKQRWFNLPNSTTETKTVTVEMVNNKWWPGYGEVTIKYDGPSGYSHFKTHQKSPMEYALNTKEYKSGDYQLIIKQICLKLKKTIYSLRI